MIINQPPPELFVERPVVSEYEGGLSYRTRRIITVTVLFTILGSVGYWAFKPSAEHAPAEIPTIKAEGNYKERPEQPGGAEIPHQDTEVYNALGDNVAPPPVEKLAPPSETPLPAAMSVPQTVEEAVTKTPPATLETLMTEQQSTSKQPVTAAAETPSVETKAEAIAEPLPEEPKAEVPQTIPTTVEPQKPVVAKREVTVAEKPKAADDATVKSVPAQRAAPAAEQATPQKNTDSLKQVLENVGVKTKTGSVVQLASIPDAAQAEHTMHELSKKYTSALGGATLRLQKADLGSKGIYYRIQTQPLTRDDAEGICRAIKNLKAGCIIVGR